MPTPAANDPQRARRNVQLAWAHVLLALLFVAGFVFVQASK